MMRKWLCALLAAALCLAGAAAGLAEDTGPTAEAAPIAEGTGWKLAQGGTLEIDANVNAMIANSEDVPWYDHMSEIVYVNVHEGVTRLGNYFFRDAKNLVHICLPEGLTNIGMSCFSQCAKMNDIRFPSTLKVIDYWAFSGCDGLREIVLSPGMEELSNYAFQNCSNLERVVAQAPLERLGFDCLEGCTALRELYLPDTLKLIDQVALNKCPALTDIHYAGTEAQWQKVEVARFNEEAMARATVHYESAYDPATASTIMAIARGSGSVVTLKGAIRVPYSPEDVVFVKGLLDDETETLTRSGQKREVVEYRLETNECVMFSGRYSADYVPVFLLFKLTGNVVMKHDTLQETLDVQDEADMAMFDKAIAALGLSDPVRETHGALDWLMYEMPEDHIAVTVARGRIVAVLAGFDTEYFDDARAYLTHVLDTIELAEVAAPEAAATPEPTAVPEEAAGRAYAFMNGKLTMRISPEEYDVFVNGDTQDPVALERQGLSESQVNMYMQMIGYELVAVPAGQPMANADFKVIVNVKDPKYQGVASLRSLSDAEKQLFARTLVTGFGKQDFEWYSTEDVDYIVFEALGSQRYATIVDGCMVYIYAKSSSGILSEDQKAELRRMVDATRWKLS